MTYNNIIETKKGMYECPRFEGQEIAFKMFEHLTGFKFKEVHFDYLESYPHYCQRFIPTACEGIEGGKPQNILYAMGKMCATECIGLVIRENKKPAIVYFVYDGFKLKTRYLHFSLVGCNWRDIRETYTIGDAENERKNADFIQLFAGSFFKVKGYERHKTKKEIEQDRKRDEERARWSLKYRLYEIKRDRARREKAQREKQDNETAQAIAEALNNYNFNFNF